MRSRWTDAEARGLEGLDLLVYASRLIGAETSLVVWGGGNTSIKTVERDHRGREIPVLRVKGSGSDLKSVQRRDFPGVRMDDILALLPRQDMGDAEMVDYLAHGLLDPGGPRPSIETLLHGFLPAHAVVHTHADAIVSLTNNDRHADVFAQVYGKDVITLPYRRPGFRISRDVVDALRQDPEATALVLERHGTITWGATVREAYEATLELITRAEAAIAERSQNRRVFGGPRVPLPGGAAGREAALLAAPRLRGVLSRRRRVIVAFDESPSVLEFVSSVDGPRLSQIGPATPDHTIYTKRLPCVVALEGAPTGEALVASIVRSVERFVAEYTRYFDENRFEGAELGDPLPRVVLVPGLGMFTTGRDRRTTGIVNDIYRHTIDVIAGASVFGEYVSLSAKDAFDVEYWPLELLRMDVSREDSVSAALGETVLAYGGLDILVSNAGIAHSCPVAELSLADWERSFAVNATGHFLVAREAMRILVAQGLGGALVFVATKNVMSPGKDFAAYSAAKAAEAQLAKVLALEGAPHGIRSNIVNPDAVFQDSKLWTEEVRRERAAAQGIPVTELEDFYRKRNLLGVRILPEDVAEAVLFLASDRSAKTTGCTLTVDGGVKDAFPR